MDVLAFFRSAEAEPYFHGTRHTFEPGQVLEGGSVRSNQGAGTPGQHVYFTKVHDFAKEFAEAGYGPNHDIDAKPRVYQVEPLDDVEPDTMEGPEVQAYRSRRVRVVREAAKATQAPSSVLSELGYTDEHSAPGRANPIAHETGQGTHVPTPSALTEAPKGYYPGEDLSGMDRHPKVAWVKLEHLKAMREYDRRDPKEQTFGSDETIEDHKRTMAEHGQREPLLISHDPHSDRARLIEGNHRIVSAEEMGWPALAVHVVRAYRHEFDQSQRHVYLGSHKVQPDEYGYTPGELHPKDALPDHMLYSGDAGLRPKTSALWEEPHPQYVPAPADMPEEEQWDKHVAPQQAIKRNWNHEVRKAMSRGDLTHEQAKANGYRGLGNDDGGWKPLPHDLYHVTTDLKGVLTHGLKSRRDLGQSSGKGLGGGEDDTISLTDSGELAHSILHSVKEFHQVVNHKYTPAQMWDHAQTGEGAARPFHKDLASMYGSKDGEVTDGMRDVFEGKKTHVETLGRTQSEMDARGDGKWSPHPRRPTTLGIKNGEQAHQHWQRDATPDEKRDNAVEFYKRFSAFREHAGGREDPLFFSTDTSGFAKMDPSNFGVVRVKPKPKAHGYQMGAMGEWRTADGSALDVTHHRTARWLPHARIFGPGNGGLDPRLFDAKKKMKPEVANVILGDLDAYWSPTFPDWRDWTRVYLAGSEASEWYGNNDFDTLLGIDHKKIRRAHPEFGAMLDDDIDSYLTGGLREHLNNEDWTAPWDGEVWHRTYYVNPNSWDIRDIKPYAAYDITRARWIVEPIHPPADWGPEKLPAAFWDEAESIVKQVHAIEAMPEPMRTGRGAALFDYLHGDRRRAFGPQGTGVYDPGNATWKYLDLHPDHPLAALVDLKRAYENNLAAKATA